MDKFLLIFFLFLGFLAHSQQRTDAKIYFSEALFMHLPKYEKKAQKAYQQRDYKEAENLFDSLVNYSLAGSYMNNFNFRNLRNKEIALSDFKKPVYLLTYASWCVPGKGEIPALNELAEKYKDEIDFVVLFWDKKKTVKKLSKNYHSSISVLYVDETDNESVFVVKQLKHSLGLPTCFLLGENKEIINIQRTVFHPYQTSEEESFTFHYEKIESGIEDHLMNQPKKDKITELVLNPE